VAQSASHLLTLIFYPEDGGEYVPPKHQFTQDLHGTTSQKTTFFKYNVDYKFCRFSSDPPNYSMDQSPSEKLTVTQPRNFLPLKNPKLGKTHHWTLS
jgi:hypothetical protein